MEQVIELVVVLAGLLAVVVGAGGKDGKLGDWLFPAPLTPARQRIVIGVGVVVVLLGTVSFIYRISPSSEATSSDGFSNGTSQTGQQPANPTPNAPDKLREDSVSLMPGDSLNMETGQFGQGITPSDISLADTGYYSRKLLPSQGSIKEIGSGADPDTCAERLQDPDADVYATAGESYCIRTSANHLAAVHVVATPTITDESTQLQYIVWNR